jgi:hypothetical protein
VAGASGTEVALGTNLRLAYAEAALAGPAGGPTGAQAAFARAGFARVVEADPEFRTPPSASNAWPHPDHGPAAAPTRTPVAPRAGVSVADRVASRNRAGVGTGVTFGGGCS